MIITMMKIGDVKGDSILAGFTEQWEVLSLSDGGSVGVDQYNLPSGAARHYSTVFATVRYGRAFLDLLAATCGLERSITPVEFNVINTAGAKPTLFHKVKLVGPTIVGFSINTDDASPVITLEFAYESKLYFTGINETGLSYQDTFNL